jgi:SAM-dependent methyltransferase
MSESTAQSGLRAALKRLYHRLPPPPSTNYFLPRFKANPYALLPPGAVIFDIGSKDGRAAYPFGLPPSDAKVVCVDIQAQPGVDLVADAHDMNMVADNTVDCVVTFSVLEHVRYPQKVVGEIYRILKPGGVVYADVPFVFPFHADPDDFYRFSYRGIDILFERFLKVESGYNRGPASTSVHILIRFLALAFSFGSKTLYGLNIDVFKWLLFWIKYLDRWIGEFPMAHEIHAGVYFLGRKPSP